ncbi:MAG: hypothetical protein HKN99_01000 [Winogradskyella sp.]|nr:hypothetical protein [Winogradskyella sp.]NNC44443.1 hypothetical protein [Winogradskyella sp.]
MKNSKSKHIEIGSIFHKIISSDAEYHFFKTRRVVFKESFKYYYSGRNALQAILEKVSNQVKINKIWLPRYYCNTVIELVMKNYKNVDYYDVDPFDSFSKAHSLNFASENDVVIVNNFWGLSKFNESYKSDIIVIEDHTHGWLSKQCVVSAAHYCFASLRKSYPIALGAVAWQPKQKNQLDYSENFTDHSIIEAYKCLNSAILLKSNYLKGIYNRKDEFLRLANKGEEYLSSSSGYTKPSTNVINSIQKFCFLNINENKYKNLEYVLPKLHHSKEFIIINSEGLTPFGLLVVFEHKRPFLEFKNHLIDNHIYPAHLWPNIDLDQKWKYLLNIHIDFRYSKSDMDYIVKVFDDWKLKRKRL